MGKAATDKGLTMNGDENYTLDVPTAGVAQLCANTTAGALRGLGG